MFTTLRLGHRNTGAILPCLFALGLCCSVTIAWGEVQSSEIEQRAGQLPYFDQVLNWQVGDTRYPALWQSSRLGQSQGTIVILPDVDQHGLWPDLQSKLRLTLPDSGWNTLSMTTANGYQPELMQQLRDYLVSRGQFNVVVIGIGQGSDQALTFLLEATADENDFGWYLVMVNNRNQALDTLRQQLSQLTIPVLDIWVPEHQQSEWLAKHRLAALRQSEGEPISQIQSTWPPARQHATMDHLSRRIWGWIRTNARGQEATVNTGPRY